MSNRFILAILLIIGMILSSFLALRNPNMEGDSVHYLIPIHHWMAGEGYVFAGEPHTDYSPGYGLLSYGVYIFVRDIEYAGMICSLLGYWASIILSYLITRYLFESERAGLVAAFLVTFYPPLLQHSYQTLTEASYTAFYLICFGLYIRSIRKPQIGLYPLLGLGLAMVYLLRPEGFSTALLVLASLLIFPGRKYAPLAMLTFALCIFPYLYFLHTHLGVWTISGKTSDPLIYYGELSNGRTEAELQQLKLDDPAYFEQGFVEYVRLRGDMFIRRLRNNTIEMILLLGGMLRHALIPLGLAFLWQRRFLNLSLPIKYDWLALLIFLSPVPVYILFFINHRFFVPYTVIILLILAGWLERAWRDDRSLGLMAAISLLVLTSLFPFFHSFSINYILTEEHDFEPMRSAGLWLEENVDDQKMVGAGKMHVIAFYRQGKRPPPATFAELPIDLQPEEIADFMRAENDRYLVIDGGYVALYANLQPLWNDPQSASEYGLKLLEAEELFQVYELLSSG